MCLGLYGFVATMSCYSMVPSCMLPATLFFFNAGVCSFVVSFSFVVGARPLS